MATSPQPIATQLQLPCGAVLPNRLCKAAMTEGLADSNNQATERHATLYRRWSDGGAGLLLTGNVQVDRRYLERPGNVVIEGPQSKAQRQALRKWAESGTRNGNHLWMQISHAGRQTPAMITREPVGPSAVPLRLPGGQFGKPRALSSEEILALSDKFAHVVTIARETGFTGAQIHSAHGYLLSEFLSPIANRRDDEWGGSLENRTRALLHVFRACRDAAGPDFPLSIKLNSSDFQKGGFTFEECLQVISWLNAEGVDLLEISGGNYEQPRMMGLEGIEPVFEHGEQSSTQRREAFFLNLAARIQQVAKMPVMVTGGFRTRAAMNQAVQSGEADMIGIARPLCVEADALTGLLSGARDALRSWEKEKRLGPGILGPNSPIALLKALNGFGMQAWFYLQLFRLADGQSAKTDMALLPAFLKYQSMEQKAARALTPR